MSHPTLTASTAKGTSDAASFFTLAQIAYSENRLGDAVKWLDKAVDRDPTKPEYQYTRGRLRASAGDDKGAETAFRAALALRPDYRDAWISLGNLLRRTEQHADSEMCHRSALQIDPRSYAAHLGLGNALLAQKRSKDALALFEEADRIQPLTAPPHFGAARACEELADWTAAANHYLLTLQVDAQYPQAAEAFGALLFEHGLLAEAIEPLEAVCANKPEAINVRLELARAYLAAGRFDSALEEYEQVLRVRPRLTRGLSGLAYVRGRVGELERSKALFESALLVASPDDSSIRMSYAETLLRNGEFERAWDLYSARPSAGHAVLIRECPKPAWAGEALGGKSLLIACEQGLGDEIMFASLYAEVIAEAAHCVLECDDRLSPLFRRSFPSATVVGVHVRNSWVGQGERRWYWEQQQGAEPPPRFDYWTAAGTVPRYKRRSRASFPQHTGYLRADAARVDHWRSELAALGPGPKVGISWSGGTPQTNRGGRSISLQQLLPVLSTPGATFVCLQYDDCAGELEELERVSGVRVHHWPQALHNYDETAALVSALDLSISVTTAVVHLAGALGRPMWTLVPRLAEWRYGDGGDSMIWYPSVRLFRQERHGEWDPVISHAQQALRAFTSERQ